MLYEFVYTGKPTELKRLQPRCLGIGFIVHMSFYDVLQVAENAALDEIKLAFKRRALEVHPDKGGSKEAFHLAYQALETLSDPESRKKYDRRLACSRGAAKRQAARPSFFVPTSSKQRTKRKDGKSRAKTNCSLPESLQQQFLVKIHCLLKQLPREDRNEVLRSKFSQNQRLILEKWMADLQPTEVLPASRPVKLGRRPSSNKVAQTVSWQLLFFSFYRC